MSGKFANVLMPPIPSNPNCYPGEPPVAKLFRQNGIVPHKLKKTFISQIEKVVGKYTFQQINILTHLVSYTAFNFPQQWGVVLDSLGIYAGNGQVIDFWPQVRKQLNKPALVSVGVVASLLGIKPEHIFDTFPSRQQQPAMNKESFSYKQQWLPQAINVSQGSPYHLVNVDAQLNFAEEVEQAVLHYSRELPEGGIDEFCILATIIEEEGDPKITFGQRAGSAFCFGRLEMDQTSEAVILFCMNTPLALHLRSLVDKANIETQAFIVSGYFVGNSGFASLELEDLREHQVVIIPEFSRDGFLQATEFAKRCRACGAMVEIYPHPIFRYACEYRQVLEATGSPWKSLAAQKGTKLYEVEIISNTLNRIAQSAQSIDAFGQHLQQLGLLSATSEDTSKQKHEVALRPKRWSDLSVTPERKIPSLETVMRPKFITFIWGASHSGKSYVALTFAIALASGGNAFFFEGTGHPQKVLILDGESDEDEVYKRIAHLTAHIPNKDVAEEHLLYQELRGQGNIMDLDVQEALIKYVKEAGVKILIIDNLITLVPEATKGQDDAFFDFIYKLEHLGVGVVFVSHANKNSGAYKGSSNLESKSQTVIHIEGNTQLKEEKGLCDKVASVVHASSPLVRLTIQKCKNPVCLTGEKGVYLLEEEWKFIDGSTYIQGLEAAIDSVGQESATPMSTETNACSAPYTVAPLIPTNQNGTTTAEKTPNVSNGESLTERDKKILKKAKEESTICRKDVEDLLGKKGSTANAALKRLVDTGHLQAFGSGASITYAITDMGRNLV